MRRDRTAGKVLKGGKSLALLCYHEQPLPLPLVAAFIGLLTGFSSAFAILFRTRHNIETPQRKESSPPCLGAFARPTIRGTPAGKNPASTP